MLKVTLHLVLALAPLATLAATPTDASILALFKAMKAESMIEGVHASLEPVFRQGLAQASAGRKLSDEQRRVLDLAPQRISAVMRRELSWDSMLDTQMAIYRDSFDQSEVVGLIEFYKSPVGQSFVLKMPAVTQRAMLAAQTQMQRIAPKLQEVTQQILEDAKLANPR